MWMMDIRRGSWSHIWNLRDWRIPSADILRDIRFLKNNGLLDCYYDFSKGSEMVFTTETGKECVRIHRYFEKTDDRGTWYRWSTISPVDVIGMPSERRVP